MAVVSDVSTSPLLSWVHAPSGSRARPSCRCGRRCGSHGGRRTASTAPWRSIYASRASGSRSRPACTTTGTGTTIPASAATPSPTRWGSSMGPVCMGTRRAGRSSLLTLMVGRCRSPYHCLRSARPILGYAVQRPSAPACICAIRSLPAEEAATTKTIAIKNGLMRVTCVEMNYQSPTPIGG